MNNTGFIVKNKQVLTQAATWIPVGLMAVFYIISSKNSSYGGPEDLRVLKAVLVYASTGLAVISISLSAIWYKHLEFNGFLLLGILLNVIFLMFLVLIFNAGMNGNVVMYISQDISYDHSLTIYKGLI